MANFATLKAAINAVIKTNGNKEITGEVLNQVLNAMVTSLGANYQFAGVATPSTNPGTPDQNVFYMAMEAGTYTNFNATVLPAGISILLWNGSWSHQTFFEIDSVPTSGSDNFISSGAVFEKMKLDGGAYDVSAHNDGAKFASLSALLSSDNLNTLIPVDVRHGGMSIKFVQSSDNKYVQFRCIADEFTPDINAWIKDDVSEEINIEETRLITTGNEFDNAYFWIDLGQDINNIYSYESRLVSPKIDIRNEGLIVITSDNPNMQYTWAVAGQDGIITRNMTTYTDLPLKWKKEKGDVYVRFNFKDKTVPSPETHISDSTLKIYQGIDLSIKNIIEGKILSKTRNVNDATIVRTQPGDPEDSPTGNRLKFIFPVRKGESIFSYQNALNHSNYATVSDTLEHAKEVNSRYIIQNIYDNWTNHAISSLIEVDGYLTIACRNSDDSSITDAQMEEFISGFDIRVGGDVSFIKKDDIQKIYLNSFAQCRFLADRLDDSIDNNRVTVKSVLAVPYVGAEITFVLPPFIKVGIRHGGDAGNLSTLSYWFINGDKFQFPSDSRFYRLSFGRETDNKNTITPSIFNPDNNDSPVSIEEILDYIKKGELYAYCEAKTEKVNVCNYEEERYIRAIKTIFTNNLSLNSNPDRLPILVHTSDVHGDNTRFDRVMDYADYIKADGVLVTGDMNVWNGDSYMDYINDSFDTHKTMGLICVGNHDAFGSNKPVSAQYEKVMKKSIDKFDYNTDSISYPTYYYKDIASKQLRIIALNEFEITNQNADVTYYKQSQIDWFIATLLSTPQNYGVVVIFHRPEVAIDSISGKDSFYQTSIPYAEYQSSTITGKPISTIIDAFISGTTLNTTFTELNPETNETDTINLIADFSNKNTGVEFLFFANGHEHSDRIGVIPNTVNRQLVCDVLSCIGIYAPSHPYYAELADMPRGGEGTTQDAFNIYAIDRTNKQIRIARVGSNMTFSLAKRDYMIVSYV